MLETGTICKRGREDNRSQSTRSQEEVEFGGVYLKMITQPESPHSGGILVDFGLACRGVVVIQPLN